MGKTTAYCTIPAVVDVEQIKRTLPADIPYARKLDQYCEFARELESRLPNLVILLPVSARKAFPKAPIYARFRSDAESMLLARGNDKATRDAMDQIYDQLAGISDVRYVRREVYLSDIIHKLRPDDKIK